MSKNIPIIIFGIILIAVLSIAIGIVVSKYNEDKPVEPNINLIGAMSFNDMTKIKEKYEDEEKKQEFLALAKKIELAVANRLLDGTVTNNEELSQSINEINIVLKESDWSSLSLDYPTYWIGTWEVNEKGAISFKFADNNIKPSWADDEQVKNYIK